MQRSINRRVVAVTAAKRETDIAVRIMLIFLGLLALAAVLAAGQPALGQEVKTLASHGRWQAYAFDENGQKACYIASRPVKDEGKYTKRGKIYAIVAHRPAEKTRDEVSLNAGYTFKKESRVRVSIDGRDFTLFPHEETAWVPSSEGDRALVAAMKAGKTMVVQGTSARGTDTKDTYSLVGFTKAYRAIAKACGL